MRRRKTITFYLTAGVLTLIIAETLCAVALRFIQGSWIYTQPKNHNSELFEPDAQLVAVPRKNISVTVNGNLYRHNSAGFRGEEFRKKGVKRRIICIGGSTTYGVGVSNNQTWPYYLDSLLQPDYEVLNLGIPGHSTAEHEKFLPEAIKSFDPDAVILHCGLNDLRNMHVEGLGHDYSPFHQQSLYATMGFCMQDRLPRIALVQAGFLLLQKTGIVSPCPFRNDVPPGSISDESDERVAETFGQNLNTLITQCIENRIEVYLLPQVLSPDKVTDDNLKWWIPYLTEKGIFEAVNHCNGIMSGAKLAFGELSPPPPDSSWTEGMKLDFKPNPWIHNLYDIAHREWTNNDFCDASHLNASGNRKLAKVIAEGLAAAGSGSTR